MEYIWANVSPESTILDTNVNIFSGHRRGLSAMISTENISKKAALHLNLPKFWNIVYIPSYIIKQPYDVVLFFGVMAIIFIHCFFLTNKSKC